MLWVDARIGTVSTAAKQCITKFNSSVMAVNPPLMQIRTIYLQVITLAIDGPDIVHILSELMQCIPPGRRTTHRQYHLAGQQICHSKRNFCLVMDGVREANIIMKSGLFIRFSLAASHQKTGSY